MNLLRKQLQSCTVLTQGSRRLGEASCFDSNWHIAELCSGLMIFYLSLRQKHLKPD